MKDRAAARMILEGEASGAADAGQDHSRRDLGQHRHRLRDGRRGARLQGEAVRAGERQPRAQADPARARRRADPDRPAGEHRRRDSRGAAAATPRIRTATSTRTSTATTATGARTTTRPRRKSSSRPAAALTHFVAGLGTSGTFVGTGRRLRKFNPGDQADLVSAATRRFTASRAEAHGVGDRARRSTIRRSPTRICAIDTEARIDMVRRLAREEGLLAGISSGAAVAAMLDVARDASSAASSSRCFPDGARKISERNASGRLDDVSRRADDRCRATCRRGDPRATARRPIRTNAAARWSAATAR